MLPLHDVNPTHRRAVVTVALLLANLGVYFLVQAGQTGQRVIDTDAGAVEAPAEVAFTLEWAAIPCEVVERQPLSFDEIRSGSCDAAGDEDDALFPDKAEWVAVLVSMFLHGGLLHLGGNLLFLWVFGNNVEDRLGPVQYLAFYLAGGVMATLGHVLVNADSTVPVVGASGAIAAVMGAYLVWFPNVRIRTLIFLFVIFFTEISAKWLLGAWFVLQFFTSDNAGVAWVAHAVGFAFGALAALVLGGRRGGRRRPVRRGPDRPVLGDPGWQGW